MTDANRRAAMLCELWARMTAIFGHRWVSQHGDTPSGVDLAEWGEAIAGLLPSQLGHGMRGVRAITTGWPPDAGQFRAMCLGLPSLIEVQRQFAGAEPITPFGRLVWRFVDAWRLRHADAATSQRMIEQAYALAVSKAMRGEPLPEPVAALVPAAPRPFVPADPDKVRAHLDAIAAVLR